MKAYTEHVVNFVRTSQLAQSIYIFEAYDESWKQGSEVEKHWGLYYEGTRIPKFQFDISSYGENFTKTRLLCKWLYVILNAEKLLASKLFGCKKFAFLRSFLCLQVKS